MSREGMERRILHEGKAGRSVHWIVRKWKREGCRKGENA